jgi:plastocyanin
LVALCGAVLAIIAPATVAHGATKTVYMGLPSAKQRVFANVGADLNAFLPGTITIHRGDKVRFLPQGFHDVDLPARGHQPAPLLTAGAAIAGATDAQGVPYWFNGSPDLQFTPVLLTSMYGRTVTYNGSKDVISGLPPSSRPKPLTVRFTKTGTFTYYCNVHPGMKAKVHVVAPKAKAPSKRSDAKLVSKQVAADLKEAKRLQNPTVAANNVLLGNAGKGGVEVYAFFPASQTVPVGTTVTFSMSPKSFEAHTATTGPGDPESQPDSFLGKLAGSLEGQIDQAAIYPSDAPPGPASLTPSTHGNGFWGTGFLDSSSATPIPSSGQVKIDAVGTYTFYCLIHPFMKATITAS